MRLLHARRSCTPGSPYGGAVIYMTTLRDHIDHCSLCGLMNTCLHYIYTPFIFSFMWLYPLFSIYMCSVHPNKIVKSPLFIPACSSSSIVRHRSFAPIVEEPHISFPRSFPTQPCLEFLLKNFKTFTCGMCFFIVCLVFTYMLSCMVLNPAITIVSCALLGFQVGMDHTVSKTELCW